MARHTIANPCYDDANWQSATHDGDIALANVGGHDLSYPLQVMGASLPLEPVKYADFIATRAFKTVNGVAGITFSLCNLSTTQTHQIQSLTLKIASLDVFADTVNGYVPCAEGGTYTRQAGFISGGGCGGAYYADVQLRASFASDASAGSTTPLVAADVTQHLLPITLIPGQPFYFETNINLPASKGTFTFQAGFTIDNKISTLAPTSPTEFFANAREWSGKVCNVPAMLAQIPADDLTTPYVCPGS